MPIDSAKPECDQALNHLELQGFSSSRGPDASPKSADRRRERDTLAHSPLAARAQHRAVGGWPLRLNMHERDSPRPLSIKWLSEGLSRSGDNVLGCLSG